MHKETVTVRRAEIMKEMAIKLGIYEDFDINDFMGVVADIILETDAPESESKYSGYSFAVVDDDYEYQKIDKQFNDDLFV